MSSISSAAAVGDLVVERPARSRVFQQYKLDFCCGGKYSLAEACSRRNVDLHEVLDALHRSDSAETTRPDMDLAAMPLDVLADHIQGTHHAYLKTELPRLDKMIQKVAAVHGDLHPWIRDVLETYRIFTDDLILHMQKEERVLFPMIRELTNGNTVRTSGGGGIDQPIHVLEHEHDVAGAALERLRELTHDYTPPDGACNTFRAALDGLRELEIDMHLHVHKENNLLFPRALQMTTQQHA